MNRAVKYMLISVACVVLVTGAVAAGYAGATHIAAGITDEAEKNVFGKTEEYPENIIENGNNIKDGNIGENGNNIKDGNIGENGNNIKNGNIGENGNNIKDGNINANGKVPETGDMNSCEISVSEDMVNTDEELTQQIQTDGEVVIFPDDGALIRYSELICSKNENTGEIDDIILQLYSCVDREMEFIYLEPECMYTMSSGLYRELANGNVLLPQTVKLAKIPEYYDGSSEEKMYGALKRIVSEMLNLEVDYYTVLSLPVFCGIFNVKSENSNDRLSLKVNSKQVLEKGEEGYSCSSFIKDRLGEASTDFEYTKRQLYFPLYSTLLPENISFYSVRMNEKNESMVADMSSISALILEYTNEDY